MKLLEFYPPANILATELSKIMLKIQGLYQHFRGRALFSRNFKNLDLQSKIRGLFRIYEEPHKSWSKAMAVRICALKELVQN